MKKIRLLLFLLPTLTFAQNTGLHFDGSEDYIKTRFNGISRSESRSVQSVKVLFLLLYNFLLIR